jgi:hypothetical protein
VDLAQELQAPVHKQQSEHSQDSDSKLNASKKSPQFHTTAQDGLVEEEEEESKLSPIPYYLREKYK